jgi:radical SAM-linked protein
LRLRITFAKTEAMRFTSHLDLHKTWERTLRRAGLPLAYTQGFSPHPRINLASALPLGFTGENEIIDIHLEKELPLEAVESVLQRAVPPGIRIERIEKVDLSAPTLQTELEALDYTITLLDDFPNLEERVEALLSAPSLPRTRREKAYDLRPLILEIHLLSNDEAGLARLSVRLASHPGATGRPEEVLEALGYSPTAARVHRTRLVFSQPITNQ